MPKLPHPCREAIRKAVKAGVIKESEYDWILEEARNRARNKARINAMDLRKEIKSIDGELKLWKGTEISRRKRNMLLSAKAVIDMADLIEKYAGENKISFGDAARYMLLGGEGKGSKGFGGGLYRRILAAESEAKALLFSKLKSVKGQDLFDYAAKGTDYEDVMTELAALTDKSIAPGSTNNAKAKMVAEIFHEVRTQINSEYRLFGGFLDEKAGYMQAQTHDYAKVRALGRKRGAMGFWEKADKQLAWERYKAQEVVLWDVNKMMEGSGENPEQMAWTIFSNLWDNKRSVGAAAADPFEPGQYISSSLTNRHSKPRVIVYKDTKAYVQHELSLGLHGDNYLQNFLGEIAKKTKTTAMLRELGPSGKGNLDKLQSILSDRLESGAFDDATKSKHTDSIRAGKSWNGVKRAFDVASGIIDSPESEALARAASWYNVYTDAVRSGSFFINSFSDNVIIPTQMVYSGCEMMDAIGKLMEHKLKSSTGAADMLDIIGVASDLFLADFHAGTLGFDPGGGARSMHSAVYKYNGMNWHTTVSRSSVADAISLAYGKSADIPMANLPENQGDMLQRYNFTPLAWDAIRSTAVKFPQGPLEGRRIITREVFDNIQQNHLLALAKEKGVSPTDANLTRIKIELREKWNEFLHDRIAAALTEPGGMDKFITTGGGIAREGTWGGLAIRAFMKYKSFPIAVVRRNLGMWQNLGFSRGMGYGMATVAGLTIAGYMSMMAKNMLSGKQRPLLFDENGELNHLVLYQAMERGGAWGPYGTLIMGDYEAYGRGLMEQVSGPVFGQAVDAIGLVKDLMPNDKEDEPGRFALNTFRFMEQSTPMLNMFYVKPAYDHALGWWIRESLRPGFLEELETKAERKHERFVVRPTEIIGDTSSIQSLFSGMPERVGKLGEKIKKMPESINGSE